jgi:hypothetical protein
MDKVILSSCYFAPINYYKLLLNSKEILIDYHENFIKQTYRNRCVIYSPNGSLNLIIPLEKKANHTPIKNVEISYDNNWQKVHWKSLEAAYRRSPYFEFYEEDFRPFYELKKWKYLIDFNQEAQELIFSLLDIKPIINYTDKYHSSIDGYTDFREMSPKSKSGNDFFDKTVPYSQTFQEKHGFIDNLSILDLLFNEGNNALSYLNT